MFLFAMLHDAMRLDDGYDAEHGPRAAALAAERSECLAHALSAHTFCETSSDPTSALCWDADRLDIGRVGFELDPAYFSTETGRALAASAQPLRWAQGPPDWSELARRFGLSP